MNATLLARAEARLRPLLARLPASLVVRLYGRGREGFLDALARQVPAVERVPTGLERTLWGLVFRTPVFNAAGMWKNGDGYELTARQGAGAWLAGTTTARARGGNRRAGVDRPFAPYPRSHAASNWLGLPNPGHEAVARRLAALPRHPGFPVGASVAATSDDAASPEQALADWVAGLRLYEEAGVDFLEVNESCPNTAEDVRGHAALGERLRYLSEGFLRRRARPLPVIVKFSCDTPPAQVPELVALLVEHGFDGVDFGNTSTAYRDLRPAIAPAEARLYDYFTATFGGGVSGRPLKERSLTLATAAVAAVRRLAPAREFHVVRTGGVEDAEDVRRSLAAGVALVQWYTGYFEAFARHGHDLYRRLYHELAAAP